MKAVRPQVVSLSGLVFGKVWCNVIMLGSVSDTDSLPPSPQQTGDVGSTRAQRRTNVRDVYPASNQRQVNVTWLMPPPRMLPLTHRPTSSLPDSNAYK